MLVRVSHSLIVNFVYIWESINDEGSQKHGVRYFVIFDAHAGQSGEGFKFRNLDKTVNVVVLEQKLLQLLESLQLANIVG